MASDLKSPLLLGEVPQSTTTNDDVTVGVDAKFGEYVSRAKARAANVLKVCGFVPFNLLMLMCIMMLTFGSYWSYDIPGSIETELTAWFGDSYTHASNLLFYSIYSWPNCILAFFGGFILDKVTGVRKGAILFCGLIALGQLIFSLGVQYKIYYLALFGRFVFGLGGENLTVAQNTYVVRWFDGKRLALAFGLVVAFSRIGTSVNFVVSPILANSPIMIDQTFYEPGACHTPWSTARHYSAELDKCVDQRIIRCSSMDSAELYSLITFPPVANATVTPACNATALATVDFSLNTCMSSPVGFNSSYPSMKINLETKTNEVEFELYRTADCSGMGVLLFTQGDGCKTVPYNSYHYQVVQPITAPCTVFEYSDSECKVQKNSWGMKRDTCVVPLNFNAPAYKFTVNPGTGVPKTVWFGMGMCAMSFIACLIASYCDFWGESKVEQDRKVFMSTLSTEEATYVRKLDDLNEPTSDDISLAMVKRIPGTAWLLFIITAVFYIAILNFYQVASDMMQKTMNIPGDTAGLYMAIPNFVAIIGSPLGGFTVDKFGRALVFICVACSMLIGAHIFFLALAYGWVTYSPVPVMVWLGITYSLGASCLWPILAFVVDKQALGTAYGCMTSVQNLFLAVAAVVIGQLQDWASSKHPGVLQYTLAIMIFIGCATIALLCTILLIILDRRNGGKLNASAEEREARRLLEDAEQEARNQANGRADSADDAKLLGADQQTSDDASPSKSLNQTPPPM